MYVSTRLSPPSKLPTTNNDDIPGCPYVLLGEGYHAQVACEGRQDGGIREEVRLTAALRG